ncbi:conserved membrane hypothetical protein [Luteimonas sp. 9C]|uniref:hypothetical protein n=1 Tax=Luteimonas sp. 9C TaxID=2653148 RepID=UPI0012EF9FAE|nr:hypothetical protein [Luteimonas sp. 9C]VXB43493.1 conserved membrane hypothetical protein [Luteimonas sp. 9C]
MEPDDLKTAWHALEARMTRSDAVQLALLRETRLARAQHHLRPLKIVHWLQALLGLGLILLGVACWTRNTDAMGLLIAGIAVHAFGVLNILGATAMLVLAGRVDYAAPVLRIQRQLAALLRAHAWNAGLCGAPWWIMWLPVVVAFAGLGDARATAGTPVWITWSLVIGGVGLAATWLHAWRHRARQRAKPDASVDCADGADGIRRSQRLLDEIAAFEAS